MKSPRYAVLVIALCACFLFYKYVLQVYPSVITDQLMREFQLTGAGLGNLAATFYYSYMVMQLFVGVLLDKYGTRWLMSAAIFSCATGVFLFSQSHTLFAAGLSRALMGLGVAFATVGYMKLAAGWFPPRQYAFVAGLLASAAMSGAVFGLAPLSFAISHLGWRTCLYFVGLIGFALAWVVVFVVRDPSSSHTSTNDLISFKEILHVFKNKQNWLLTFYSGLAFSPLAIFSGLWGNPFLEQAYHFSPTQTASLVSLVFIGLGIGSPVLGLLSDRLNDRRNVMFFSTLLSCFSISVVLYCHPLPTWVLATLLFTFGFSLGAFMLVFAIGKELNSPALTATVIAMINTSDAMLDAITEPGIGKLLDLTWDGTIVHGVHHFSLSSYHMALSVLPLYLGVATLLLLFLKENRN